ncbi:hypothetical protein HPB47_024290 [Ixodes persulcatus]|uniref:Uncharacterized protein n=1 Tax=Ixodes persulcatus TaxID=34615 RepID=A0AC60Q4N5_IXOPE|nr:hypothetical protein HPB47_024290 [Ixodes persulcatus]
MAIAGITPWRARAVTTASSEYRSHPGTVPNDPDLNSHTPPPSRTGTSHARQWKPPIQPNRTPRCGVAQSSQLSKHMLDKFDAPKITSAWTRTSSPCGSAADAQSRSGNGAPKIDASVMLSRNLPQWPRITQTISLTHKWLQTCDNMNGPLHTPRTTSLYPNTLKKLQMALNAPSNAMPQQIRDTYPLAAQNIQHLCYTIQPGEEPDGGIHSAFSLQEPTAAVRKLKRSTAQGPDQNHRHFVPTMVGFHEHVSTQDVARRIHTDIYDYKSTAHLRTIVGVDTHKAFNNTDHATILQNLDETQPGCRLVSSIMNFLMYRTLCISDPDGNLRGEPRRPHEGFRDEASALLGVQKAQHSTPATSPDALREQAEDMDSQESLPGGASQHSSCPTWTADDTLEIPPPKKVKAAPVPSISPYPTPSPDRSFRVHIRPTVRFDVTAVPTKCIQHVIDQCLGTRGYQGFGVHKASNTITVHLASIEDADKICAISRIPINADNQLSVQAYFASGPNVQRCVVYGLDPTDPCATIIQDLKSQTHTVLAVRRMGASMTYLVTVQGAQTLPEKFYCKGCIVRPKLYRPPEGLSPCARPPQSVSAPLIVYNSFQALESAENTQPEEAEETALKGSSSYAAALKRPGKKGRQSADPSSGNPPEPTGIPVIQDDLDTEIAQLSRQIELLRQRKARVAARRKERAATPPHAGTQISPAPMPLQTENTTPFDPAYWMASDAWGSDHSPILIGLHTKHLKKLRCKIRVTHWDKVRSDDHANSLDTTTLISTLQSILADSTTLTTVDEDQPTPDIPLLKLWAERRQAELQANRNPLQPEGRVLVNHITARAQRHEKQLSRCRWYGWCDSLGSGAGNKALWRTFRAMERGGQQADPSASIRLALNLTPEEFAKKAAVSFFPNHQQPPIDPPSNEAMDTFGLTDPFKKAELIAAIEATKKHSSPGYDNIPYELFKNLEGEAIDALLQVMNQVWAEGIIPPEWKHSVVVPIPKQCRQATDQSSAPPTYFLDTNEYHKKYHPTQIGFRANLGTEDGLAILADEVLHVSPHSHLVRTVVATDISKAYDNIQPEIIIRNMETLGLPKPVTKVVHSFICSRKFSVRVDGQPIGSFTSNRGVPQGSVLAPLLFNIPLMPLAWSLQDIPNIKFLIYADDVTLWSTHRDLNTQRQHLQEALDVLHAYAQTAGLDISPQKSCYTQVANKSGRKVASKSNFHLKIGPTTIPETEELRVLWLDIHQSGSGTHWLQKAKKSSATTLHLIRRIAPRSGGARTEVARRLVRSVLQPRLVYQAQFQRLTSQQWARLEVVNRDAMRATTALPRLTPIPTLQEHAQLNTLTELVNQREQARILKRKHIPAAAALHSYFYGGPPLTATLDDIPPWCYTNITTNKTTKLRRSDQPAPTPETSIPQGQCVVYTDAAVLPRGGRVAFVSPSHPGIQATCNYKSDTPDSLLLELQAIHDAIKAVIGLPDIKEAHIYTDSLNSIKHLKQVTQTLQICQQIHILHQKTTINIKVHWVQGHSQNHSNLLADHHAHHTQPLLDLLLASLPCDPRSDLIAQKNLLRRDTRALIPPCVCSLPRNLSRVEEVSLRRLRAGAALTPSVTWTWGHRPADPGTCPKCQAPVATADAHHLLWLCSGTKTTREKILREAGLKGHPHDNYTQWVNDNKYYKSLLQFLYETGLHSFL